MLTKRDVASACRLLRLRPYFRSLMATEIPGKYLDIPPCDIVLKYLEIPFGRNGPPAHFSVFGDAITAPHCVHGVVAAGGDYDVPFAPRLYVGDGIFSDVDMQNRLQLNTRVGRAFGDRSSWP